MLTETGEALSTVASIGATLAGFSSLAIAFGPKRGSLNLAQKLTVRVIMMLAISAMLFALAPLPFIIAGARPEPLWVVCLGALAAHLIFFAIVPALDLRRRSLNVRWSLFLPFTVIQGAVGVLMLLGALDVGGFRGPATYIAGLIWLVGVASIQLIFHIYQIHARLDTVASRDKSQPSGE